MSNGRRELSRIIIGNRADRVKNETHASRIFANTSDGTGWCTAESIHIEHVGDGIRYGLTDVQRFSSADLIAWLIEQHTDVALKLTGRSEQDWGRAEDAGITCHRFIQLGCRELKVMEVKDKKCPGSYIIDDLGNLLMLAWLVSIKNAIFP